MGSVINDVSNSFLRIDPTVNRLKYRLQKGERIRAISRVNPLALFIRIFMCYLVFFGATRKCTVLGIYGSDWEFLLAPFVPSISCSEVNILRLLFFYSLFIPWMYQILVKKIIVTDKRVFIFNHFTGLIDERVRSTDYAIMSGWLGRFLFYRHYCYKAAFGGYKAIKGIRNYKKLYDVMCYVEDHSSYYNKTNSYPSPVQQRKTIKENKKRVLHFLSLNKGGSYTAVCEKNGDIYYKVVYKDKSLENKTENRKLINREADNEVPHETLNKKSSLPNINEPNNIFSDIALCDSTYNNSSDLGIPTRGGSDSVVSQKPVLRQGKFLKTRRDGSCYLDISDLSPTDVEELLQASRGDARDAARCDNVIFLGKRSSLRKLYQNKRNL